MMRCAATEEYNLSSRVSTLRLTSMDTIEEAKLCVLKCVKKVNPGEPCFRLSSGKVSPYYIDLRPVLYGDVKCLEIIAEAMLELLQRNNIRFDVIACKALGSVSLAVALALKTGSPLVVLRERVKDYGTGGSAVGALDKVKGASVLIVDDVATTGKTLLEVLNFVKNLGAVHAVAAVVVDRQEGAKQLLRQHGCELYALFTRSDLGITDEWLNEALSYCSDAPS